MSELGEQVSGQEDEVERMVKELMAGVERFGNFDGRLGVGAVLTFTNRFLQTIVQLTPDPERRENNTVKMASALRRMAAALEFEHAEIKKMKVH